MFPQLKKIDNESGVVLFIVLMTVIIILIFSAGILTQSMNEINYAQQQIDQITCDQLKRAYFWNAYSSDSMQNVSVPINVDNRTYTVSMASVVNASGGYTWQVNCTYDTFQ